MWALLTAAAIAGLMGAPHCIGMCGGFAAAAQRPAHQLAWQAGRLTTYATLGAIVGAAGGAMPAPGWILQAAAMTFLLLFSAQLAGLIRLPEARATRLARLGAALLRRGGLAARFGFGLVTGMLPCGLVYAALGLSLSAGSAAAGAAAMVAFGVGTMPALAVAAAGLRTLMDALPRGRQLMAAAVLVAGTSAVFARPPATTSPAHAASAAP